MNQVQRVTLKRRKHFSKRKVHPRLKQAEMRVLESQSHPSHIQDLNHQEKIGFLINQKRYQERQGVDHLGELLQRISKGEMKVVDEAVDLQKGTEGHLQDQEDGVNHQDGEADHQGVAVVLQGGGVNLQDGTVDLDHHGDGEIVISIRIATLKDKRIRETQMESKFFVIIILISAAENNLLKKITEQRAKKVVSDSLELVDFSIGLANILLKFLEKFKLQKNCSQCRSSKHFWAT